MARKKDEDVLSEQLETTHPDYSIWKSVWEKDQDASDGEDIIKLKGETYLPKTSLMELSTVGDELYENYKMRASYFNGTGRTVDGLQGLVFRNKVKINLPEIFIPWIEDFTMNNESLESFVKKYINQIIVKNRVGLFIDYPVKSEEMTVKESENLNYRPFAIMYQAESILDWDEERIGNVFKTSFVMLKETERRRNDLIIEVVEKRRILDLSIDQEEMERLIDQLLSSTNEKINKKDLESEILRIQSTLPRYYRQRVYEKVIDSNLANFDASKEKWKIVQEFFPTDAKGNRFNSIPFFCTTDREENWNLDYSMINDLADVNIAHYRNSADLENLLHVGGNPTACVKGLISNRISNPNIEEHPSSTDTQVPLGINSLLEFETDGNSWFLEANLKGADSLMKSMETKKNEMALLGTRIIASDPKGVESAETANIHRAGEQGVLTTMVGSTESTMKKALSFMYMWQTGTNISLKDIGVEFNRKFTPEGVDPSTVSVAIQALQEGEISSREFYGLLQRGEWVNPDVSYEEHLKEIEADKERKGSTEPSLFEQRGEVPPFQGNE
ncbi:MAG: DUF4055 domain-containing protein [Candidatus Hodarchaeota archaeon]